MTDPLLEGVRNTGLCSYAGSLRARGFSTQEILTALREANLERCIPPLPDIEILNICKSAAKWAQHPTVRGNGALAQRAVYIPRGCFDPRPAVCGFSPAAVVAQDKTLRLRRRHAALYAYLAGIFGNYGCHPCQRTIGEVLGTPQQDVARHIGRLVCAGLILVERGAYRKADQRFNCNSYHFVRHRIFAAHFTRRGLPVFSEEGLSYFEELPSPVFVELTESLTRLAASIEFSGR
jgi:hypothetical protein